MLPFAMTITALDFYPRSPCGERPKRYLPCCTSRIFLSTLSLRRATSDCRTWTYERLISIHALLAESDTPAGKVRPWASHISIHALLAESDATKPSDYLDPSEFLSTLSLRRATKRAVRGTMRAIISIHALLAESDAFYNRFKPCARYFYPRSPCGERLKLPPPPPLLLPISIHALLAESDVRQGMATLSQPIFLSTLSLRRATCGAVWGRCAPQISIHALLAESDCFCLCHLPAPGNFYPRSPCGERQPTRS